MSDKEISGLSVAERILLMQKIWDSIEHDNLQLSLSHQQELDKRLERFKQGETQFYSWDEIKQDLRAGQAH